jgi:cell division protein FtsZ
MGITLRDSWDSLSITDGDGCCDEGSAFALWVVSCGVGCDTVSRLVRLGLDGAFTVAINTDCRHVAMVEADTKILMGNKPSKGLGSGEGSHEVGRKAAEITKGFLEEVLKGADMAFATAGMAEGRVSELPPWWPVSLGGRGP